MILSDYDLENLINGNRLVVRPYDKEILRENGLDLRLADEIGYHNTKLGKDFILDPTNPKHIKDVYIVEKGKKELIIRPQTRVLLSTMEYVEMPDNLVGFVELRSTWARHGLFMPPTIIDAGFAGTITLEVFNSNSFGIKLVPSVRFAHVIFATTLNRVKNTYAGEYHGQRGVRLPKIIK